MLSILNCDEYCQTKILVIVTNDLNKKEGIWFSGFNSYDFGSGMYDVALARWMSIDPLAEKYYSISPYVYCMNNPVKFVDPNGEDVYIIFYGAGDERYKAAAETRQGQIQRSDRYNSEKDHIYMMEIGDLGTLEERVNNIISDATDNGYGMTVEASFYTHGGGDGPIGDTQTSGMYSLSKLTGSILDGKQLSGAGWSNINFNFDSNNSIAAFYGCQTAGFAERFFEYSNAQYTAGQGGRVGPSYSTDNFDSVGYLASVFGISRQVFYGDNQRGKFVGVYGYSRNYNSNGLRNEYQIKGNAGVKKGVLTSIW